MKQNVKPATFLRRLGALLYDTLLAISFVIFMYFVIIGLFTWLGIQNLWSTWVGHTFFLFNVFGLPFLFFAWFWTHGGQTLGARAWKLRVVNFKGHPLNWWMALKRFLFAIPSLLMLAIGYCWILFDRDNLALHDRLSGTMMVQLYDEKTDKKKPSSSNRRNQS